jgi:hypothetical protein
VASSVGQEGLFLALPFFRLQLSAQLLLGPERRTRARILYSFFFFSFLSFFSDKMKGDLFIQGRMKSGREISTVVLVLVFGLTGSTLCLSPLRARHVLHQMADLIQVELLRYGEREREILVVSLVHEPSLKDSGESSIECTRVNTNITF